MNWRGIGKPAAKSSEAKVGRIAGGSIQGVAELGGDWAAGFAYAGLFGQCPSDARRFRCLHSRRPLFNQTFSFAGWQFDVARERLQFVGG